MPGSIRLFVPDALAAGATVATSPSQAHYLGTVMRRASGDPVSLFNGRDGEWLARIAALRRERCTLEIETGLRPQAPETDHWLVFAVLKRDATDLVVQKATELGASEIHPVFTERTNAGRVNEERLAAIAVEAAEQSERLTVPRIAPACRLIDLLARWPTERKLIVAAERVHAPPLDPVSGMAALLVGPEGGFAPTELDALRRHAFVVSATLGPRILRADTAAIVGLALLQAPAGGQDCQQHRRAAQTEP